MKSRRGRKKTIKTQGYACVNEACAYYGITDEAVHAVIGYGCRGKCELIQSVSNGRFPEKLSDAHLRARAKASPFRVHLQKATKPEDALRSRLV